MADKNLLEQLKLSLEGSGVEATKIIKLMQDLQSVSDEVVSTMIEQQKQLQKNKDLINETLTLSELELSANKRIAGEAKALFEQRKIHEEEISIKKNEILATEQAIIALEEKKKANANILSDSDEEELEANRINLQLLRDQLEVEQSNTNEIDVRTEKLKIEQGIHKTIIISLEQELSSMVAMDKVWNSIKNGASISSSLFAQFAANATDLLGKVNAGNAEFAATTGQIADRTIMFGYGLSQFGIGFEKLNKASMDLYTSMSSFSTLNKSTQLELAESAAKMDLLGVSASTTGKILNDLTKGFRMTAQEASQTNEYIAKVAIGIGVAPSKMAADFASAMPKLQAYGKQGIEVFADLQKQAKSLGMEMNTLMGIIGDTFDTFEGGARAAGRLNAVLGGDYLNSVDMLNATESERVEILKRSFDMSGKNFDSLDKYEKKAIAATLGISDLNEASKLFGSSTADLTADMQQQAASQAKLEEVQREAVKTQEKMNQIFNAFLIIIRPLVSIIEGLVNVITILNDTFGGQLVTVLGAAALGFKFFTGSGLGALTALKNFGSGIVDNIRKLKQFRETMAGFGGGVQGFKAAFNTLFGGGMGPQGPAGPVPTPPVPNVPPTNPASAFSFQKTMISLRNGIQAFGLRPERTLLGAAILTAVSAMLAVSLGAFAIALKQFKDIDFEQTMKGLGVLSLLTAAAIGLGAGPVPAMVALGAGALVLLSIAFADLGASLINLSEGLSGLTQFNLSLAALTNSASGASIMVDAISEISSALEGMPEGKEVTLRALNDTLYTAKTIKEEEIRPAKDFITAAREYYVAQEKSKESDKDALVNALKELKNIMTPKQSNQPLNVKLILNDGQVLTGKLSGLNVGDIAGSQGR